MTMPLQRIHLQATDSIADIAADVGGDPEIDIRVVSSPIIHAARKPPAQIGQVERGHAVAAPEGRPDRLEQLLVRGAIHFRPVAQEPSGRCRKPAECDDDACRNKRILAILPGFTLWATTICDRAPVVTINVLAGQVTDPVFIAIPAVDSRASHGAILPWAANFPTVASLSAVAILAGHSFRPVARQEDGCE